MSLMMHQQQTRALSGAVRRCAHSGVARRSVRQPRLVVQAGLFNFLSQPTAAKSSARANEIVDELLALTRKSDVGRSFSQQKREQVAELIEELQQYCPRNVLRNKLLFGTYEVLYASNIESVGGKFRTGAGPIVFPGQTPFQILEEPNTLINRIEFKTLGFLPGYGLQNGTFKALNSDTIQINLTERRVNTGFGEQVAEIDLIRKVQILYLDERCRVTRGFADPVEGEEPRPDVLFVFERVAEETKEEAVEEEAPAKGTTIVPVFGGQGRKPGLATMAERKVRQQLEADAQTSGKPAPKVAAKAAPARGTGVVKAGRQAAATSKGVDPRAAAAEKRKAEAEAAKAKQREADERAKREEAARLAKEKAEAERQVKQQRLAAVKEALNKLGGEIQEAQVASRAAKVELRDVEKETQATNKKTAEARAKLEAAIARTQSAAEELQAALDARNNAQAEARQAQAAFKDAEKTAKEQIALVTRK